MAQDLLYEFGVIDETHGAEEIIHPRFIRKAVLYLLKILFEAQRVWDGTLPPNLLCVFPKHFNDVIFFITP
jgi:hypothetical protein